MFCAKQTESKQTTKKKPYRIPEYHELKCEKKQIQKGRQEVCGNWEGIFGSRQKTVVDI